ncbi:MAG: glycerophosphoryl diester phosphodiesterase [Gammaproteobacteria bacterium]|jgi:glycerophosphoryl diester phosphodiesterase|nr:MAG: glycerophosphoryl diester phosphodiesterase [Gammaproteobacteria bacterium]
MSGFDAPPVIIGHRGAAGLEPENTLPSFRAAVALGVQAVELDVHVCEGHLVVIHDPTLERTTNGKGAVSQTTFPELRKLDAGTGAVIPTLAEVVAELPEHIGLNVELKGAGTAPVLAQWLPVPGRRQVLVSSFDHDALRTFRDLRADYPTAPLFGRWKPDALDIAASFHGGYINLSRKLATASRLEAIGSAGLKALVYTVNDLKEARRLLGDGAWGLFTDYPDRINRESLGVGR